jgi:hypothetical protein
MRTLSLTGIAATFAAIATPASATGAMPTDAACVRPAGIQRVVFSARSIRTSGGISGRGAAPWLAAAADR